MRRNARIVSLERGEEVKIRTLAKLLGDLFWRKSLVGEDNPLADVVVDNKGPVGRRVD